MSKSVRFLLGVIMGVCLLLVLVSSLTLAQSPGGDDVGIEVTVPAPEAKYGADTGSYVAPEAGNATEKVLTPLAPQADYTTTASFAVTPDLREVNPGQAFTVAITVDNVTVTVNGWQIALGYDTSVVTMTGFTEGDFLNNCGATLAPPPVWQPTEGEMMFNCACLFGDSGGKISGTLAIVDMIAQPAAVGQSGLTIDITDTIVSKLAMDADAYIPLRQNIHNGTVRIVICDPVSIDNLQSDSPVYEGQTMHFTATVGGDTPITYTWDFDSDGTPEQSGVGLDTVSYVYPSTGTYTVTLDVENGCPSTDTDFITVTVNPVPCVHVSIDDLQSDSPVELGTAMHFTATVSGDTPITYTWDFGGTGTQGGTDTNPTFDYASTGTYTVTLDVENGCPSTDTGFITVTVNPVPCVHVSIDVLDSDSPVNAGQTMHFTATVSGDTPVTYTWDFDSDGTPEQSGVGLSAVNHTYASSGTYTVTLDVENGCPSTDTHSIQVTVNQARIYLPLVSRNYPPCEPVNIDALDSDSPVTVGETMHFTATVSGSTRITYTWDFGGAGTPGGTDTNPTYTYDAVGAYTVTLVVTNACGTDTDLIVVTVNPPPCQPASITSLTSDSPVELGEVMHFTATVTGDRPVVYFWNFGTGTWDGADANPTYTYDAEGTYTVTLFVANDCGYDIDSIVVTVTPDICIPVDITDLTSSSPVTVGEAIYFTATVTGDTPITYTWDFDSDGTPEQIGIGLDTVVYTYTEAGPYVVTLDVENECGTDTEVLAVIVNDAGMGVFTGSIAPSDVITSPTEDLGERRRQ